jgi:hypothetical protein
MYIRVVSLHFEASMCQERERECVCVFRGEGEREEEGWGVLQLLCWT